MLVRFLFIAAGLAAAALLVPDMAASYLARNGGAANEDRAAAAMVVSASQSGGGRISLPADARGHFFGDFRINGRTERGLVDTGASMIALSESMARRLGYTAAKLDFRHTVETANGKAQAAHVVLDRVEIGTVSARKVDAMVLKDGMLTTMLVGMSFLNTLSSYQVANGKLQLVN